MKIKMTTMLKIFALTAILLGFPVLLRATPPKGSLTIDRVSEIKCP